MCSLLWWMHVAHECQTRWSVSTSSFGCEKLGVSKVETCKTKLLKDPVYMSVYRYFPFHQLSVSSLLSLSSSLHSGGHLNPAVTLGVLVAGGVNILAALVYFIAQMTGGIVGAACVLVSLSS